jgi:hypothetical protein
LATSGQFQNIVHYFPFRGHLLKVCDRDFATVKRKISRLDRIYSYEEQLAVIKHSVKTGKFTVNRVDGKNSIRLNKFVAQTLQKSSFANKLLWEKSSKTSKLYLSNQYYIEFRCNSENRLK